MPEIEPGWRKVPLNEVLLRDDRVWHLVYSPIIETYIWSWPTIGEFYPSSIGFKLLSEGAVVIRRVPNGT